MRLISILLPHNRVEIICPLHLAEVRGQAFLDAIRQDADQDTADETAEKQDGEVAQQTDIGHDRAGGQKLS